MEGAKPFYRCQTSPNAALSVAAHPRRTSEGRISQSESVGEPLRGEPHGANLTDASLCETNLTGANLSGADLTGANLSGADLSGKNAPNLSLTGADLTKTYLFWVNLTGADLSDANLSEADLTGATGLTQEQINQAYGDKHTKLPGGLKWPPTWSQGSVQKD